MRMRGRSAVLLASLSLLGFWTTGCGSKKASSAPPTATSSSGAVNRYRAGEVCAGRSESLYAAQGLACVTGRLQLASTARYHAGQFCSGRTATIYAAARLKCVQGRLVAK